MGGMDFRNLQEEVLITRASLTKQEQQAKFINGENCASPSDRK